MHIPETKTLDRSLLILQTIADEGPLPVRSLQQRLSLPKSSAYRFLQTLRASGLVYLDASGWLRLGPGVAALMTRYLSQNTLPLICQPEMRELCQITEETVILTVLDWPYALCIEKIEPRRTIKASYYDVGKRGPLYAGTSGKILLAYLPDNLINTYIRTTPLYPYTKNTPTTESQLRKQLETIRSLGYSCTDEELDDGVSGISVPLFNRNGQVLAGLSVVGPSERIDRSAVLPILVRIRDRIAEKL